MTQETDQLRVMMDGMTDEDWRTLYKKLLLYTYKEYGWLRRQSQIHLEDIVQQAILLTIEGRRVYRPVDQSKSSEEGQRSLFVFLCGVIRSLISHAQQKNTIRLDISKSESDRPLADAEDAKQDNWGLPFKEYLELTTSNSIDNPITQKELADRIYQSLGDDETLLRIVKLILEEDYRRLVEIAERLGISVQEMHNARKRLRRRLADLQKGVA